MDLVARTIYPKGNGPIMEIESKLGTFTTFREAVLQIDDLNMTLSRDFSLRQRMTWCGLTEAEYHEAQLLVAMKGYALISLRVHTGST